jgi:hypothetical protein
MNGIEVKDWMEFLWIELSFILFGRRLLSLLHWVGFGYMG